MKNYLSSATPWWCCCSFRAQWSFTDDDDKPSFFFFFFCIKFQINQAATASSSTSMLIHKQMLPSLSGGLSSAANQIRSYSKDVIGIDLGTTNSCVAVMAARTRKSSARKGGTTPDGGVHGKRRTVNRATGEEASGDEPFEHVVCVQTVDWETIRRPHTKGKSSCRMTS